jgi:hypothetical protein
MQNTVNYKSKVFLSFETSNVLGELITLCGSATSIKRLHEENSYRGRHD